MFAKKIGDSKSDLFLMSGSSNGKPAWYYIKVNKLKIPIFKHKCDTKSQNVNLEDYGNIVASGWGAEPPAHIKAKIENTEPPVETSEPTGNFAIYQLEAMSLDNRPVYYYVAVPLSELETFMKKMNGDVFDVAEHAVVLISGYGEPTEEVKALMEREYGYDHAAAEDPNAPVPVYVC